MIHFVTGTNIIAICNFLDQLQIDNKISHVNFYKYPEGNTYPSLHGQIADNFIDIYKKEFDYVIISNSEHVFNRFRLRIAEEKINHEDFFIHYFDSGKHHEMKANMYGCISNWVKGFSIKGQKTLKIS